MYSQITIDDVDTHEIDEIEPAIRPIGAKLRPSEMRPSVWEYEEGESNNLHYQDRQEELYLPLSGRFELRIDDETIEIERGNVVVVEPDARRQLTALTAGRLLVIGAPAVEDDGVVVETE